VKKIHRHRLSPATEKGAASSGEGDKDPPPPAHEDIAVKETGSEIRHSDCSRNRTRHRSGGGGGSSGTASSPGGGSSGGGGGGGGGGGSGPPSSPEHQGPPDSGAPTNS
uniref:Eukaryotic translation initiation factor 4 gamma 3 n=1 Tax=Homo sapiens TaxID=9606 RepID=A0A8I5QKZ5_HUMAN